MYCNAIFEHILQNISKRNCIDQWLGKCYCILGLIWPVWGVDEQMPFVPNAVFDSGGQRHPRKILQFLLSFELGKSISST